MSYVSVIKAEYRRQLRRSNCGPRVKRLLPVIITKVWIIQSTCSVHKGVSTCTYVLSVHMWSRCCVQGLYGYLYKIRTYVFTYLCMDTGLPNMEHEKIYRTTGSINWWHPYVRTYGTVLFSVVLKIYYAHIIMFIFLTKKCTVIWNRYPSSLEYCGIMWIINIC